LTSAGCRQGLLSSDSAGGQYAMRHGRLGKFIIISNADFNPTTTHTTTTTTTTSTSSTDSGLLCLPVRRAAERDVALLDDAFSRLGFDVVVHCNRTALQMYTIIAAGMHDCIYLSVENSDK